MLCDRILQLLALILPDKFRLLCFLLREFIRILRIQKPLLVRHLRIGQRSFRPDHSRLIIFQRLLITLIRQLQNLAALLDLAAGFYIDLFYLKLRQKCARIQIIIR